MTPDQAKAARNLLGWSRDRLGAMSGATADTISNYERYGHLTWGANGLSGADQLATIRAALEAAGVEFTEDDAPGVRLRKPAGPE